MNQLKKGPLKLSILDQSIVHHGRSAKAAVDNTIDTIQLAERLGYHRFWVSEHHNSSFIAGSAPEILIVKLASVTKKIRVGSGGIMLPNHSAFKVAENFRMLETLYPGRIDLGMGRAPGGDRISASLLNPSNTFSEADYLQQLQHLQHFFHDTAGTKYGPILAVPQATTIPEQWILSSSGGSAGIAAKNGMGLAVAKFINGEASPQMVADYRNDFVPSAEMPEPMVLLAISVLCAETEEKALEMRKFIDYVLVQFEKGNFDNIGNPDLIRDYVFSQEEELRIKQNSGRVISGTPASVKAQLEKLAADFDVDEIMMSCMFHEEAARLRSFELIAENLI
ncbi:MAG: luciferase-like monooxygenase family protein [Ferruginibacter sp.]|nr:luciferase-like monooxygenase family protein [Ferruginibacter sp.]